jgi:hypothetical protein
VEIKLPVTLEHCVEAAVREAYHERLSVCLGGEDPVALAACDTLARFAETADFPALRRLSEPHLLDGKRVCFVIFKQGDEVVYRLETD